MYVYKVDEDSSKLYVYHVGIYTYPHLLHVGMSLVFNFVIDEECGGNRQLYKRRHKLDEERDYVCMLNQRNRTHVSNMIHLTRFLLDI